MDGWMDGWMDRRVDGGGCWKGMMMMMMMIMILPAAAFQLYTIYYQIINCDSTKKKSTSFMLENRECHLMIDSLIVQIVVYNLQGYKHTTSTAW
jgi:hypothetical protein